MKYAPTHSKEMILVSFLRSLTGIATIFDFPNVRVGLYLEKHKSYLDKCNVNPTSKVMLLCVFFGHHSFLSQKIFFDKGYHHFKGQILRFSKMCRTCILCHFLLAKNQFSQKKSEMKMCGKHEFHLKSTIQKTGVPLIKNVIK